MWARSQRLQAKQNAPRERRTMEGYPELTAINLYETDTHRGRNLYK